MIAGAECGNNSATGEWQNSYFTTPFLESAQPLAACRAKLTTPGGAIGAWVPWTEPALAGAPATPKANRGAVLTACQSETPV